MDTSREGLERLIQQAKSRYPWTWDYAAQLQLGEMIALLKVAPRLGADMDAPLVGLSEPAVYWGSGHRDQLAFAERVTTLRKMLAEAEGQIGRRMAPRYGEELFGVPNDTTTVETRVCVHDGRRAPNFGLNAELTGPMLMRMILDAIPGQIGITPAETYTHIEVDVNDPGHYIEVEDDGGFTLTEILDRARTRFPWRETQEWSVNLHAMTGILLAAERFGADLDAPIYGLVNPQPHSSEEMGDGMAFAEGETTLRKMLECVTPSGGYAPAFVHYGPGKHHVEYLSVHVLAKMILDGVKR